MSKSTSLKSKIDPQTPKTAVSLRVDQDVIPTLSGRRVYDMTVPFSGGCACRQIRYTCTVVPIAMLNCHCQDCQISSGAPFASGFIVPVALVQVTGTTSDYTVTAASGGKTTRTFCGTCGTPLFTRGETVPDLMSIRFPTLDDRSDFVPALEIWPSRAQPWTCLDQAIPKFEQSP